MAENDERGWVQTESEKIAALINKYATMDSSSLFLIKTSIEASLKIAMIRQNTADLAAVRSKAAGDIISILPIYNAVEKADLSKII